MIPKALINLFASEKAFAGGILVIAATVFVFLDRMTVVEWQDFCTWVFGIYAAGKTATSVVTTMKNGTVTSIPPVVTVIPEGTTPSEGVVTEVK